MRDGDALTLERPAVRWPAGPDWAGTTVAILASGPSMSAEVAERVRDWRHDGGGAIDMRRRVIAINTTFRLVTWADVLYACDGMWWDSHIAEVRDTFKGALWSQDVAANMRHKVNQISAIRSEGLGKRPGVIHQGMNSGYQAINFAWQTGATRILLAGYDMRVAPDGRSHWHGNHPPVLSRNSPYRTWLPQFEPLARDLAAEGCAVVNCTPSSALKAFPVAELTEALT